MRSTLGLYRPGHSVVHRLPASVKLIGLFVLGASSVMLQRWWWAVLIALVATTVGYLIAGFTPRIWWQQLRPMWMLLVFTAGVQTWTVGWQRATAITASIMFLVCLAALVTLTTPTMALIDVVVRVSGPFRRLGVDPERVGLFLLLGIRAVPLVAGLARECHEAQLARGATTSARAFMVPLVVRALREADAMGEALAARGVDD